MGRYHKFWSKGDERKQAGADAKTHGADATEGETTRAPSHALIAQRELLDRVREFFIRHELPVTSSNLALVCSGLSGSNGAIAEAFAKREISKEPIDQRWLDTLERLDPGVTNRMGELEQLIDRIEYSLLRFARNTRSVCDETNEYRGAMSAELKKIDASGGADRVERVLALSHNMLERLEQIENAMEQSHRETEELRNELAKARIEADVDHLTRLPNRRAFERQLAALAEQAETTDRIVTVGFCDIDHFKQVNDTHGHEAGDRILRAVADNLSETLGADAFVARHGGEEFVALFSAIAPEEAWRRLDLARRMLERRQLMNRATGKPFGRITFSAGIARVHNREDTRAALARADAALYRAKQSGRNQVVLDSQL